MSLSSVEGTFIPGTNAGSFGSLAPLWCCQATQRVFSGFSCFVEHRSGQNFGVRGRAKFTSVGTFPLVAHVLKFGWDKTASFPPFHGCQRKMLYTHRFKTNNPSQSTTRLHT